MVGRRVKGYTSCTFHEIDNVLLYISGILLLIVTIYQIINHNDFTVLKFKYVNYVNIFHSNCLH